MRAAAANTAADDGSQRSTKISGEMSLPIISVVVPTDTSIVMNPNNLSLSVNLDGSIDANDETAQIYSTPSSIENRSEVPISVTVAVTGAINTGSTLRLSSTTTKDSGTTAKRAFVYFEMQAVTDPNGASWDQEFDETKHIVVGTNTKTRKNYITLAAPDENGKATKCYGAFRLTGDCTEKPKVAWDTTTDGFTAKIVFTFKALGYNTQVD
jgi:hypothetical protein